MARKHGKHHVHRDHDHNDDHGGQVQLIVGPSSSQTPYVVATKDGVWFTSLLSVGDQVGVKADGSPWRMVGIPDGLGAFDNGDGTITVLMNHELGQASGVVREHGQTGAFVSKLIIDKETLQVTHAEDLSKNVFFYNRDLNSYVEDVPFNGTAQFGRLCSADLPAVSAFYDTATGLGTQERIFLNGEEIGNEGRSFAHIVTGAEAGNSYELPVLGRMSWENVLANPASGAKTVVIGTDDSTPGEVYLYVGDKKATGSAIEKAGLADGKLFGIQASFGDDTGVGATPPPGTFSLVPQGNDGDASDTTGTQLNNAAGLLTQFGRPEDGAWDPSNPNRLYFVTTGATVNGVPIPTRLWVVEFIDVEHPELGGTIKVAVEGGLINSTDQTIPVMLDNMTVTESGLVFMQEDPGNNPRLAKLWMYDPNADTDASGGTSGLTLIAQHDPARFTNPAGATATPAPGSITGFGQDEESSGIVDVTGLLGNDQRLAFLLDTQAHYGFSPAEFVEGGQLMTMYVDLPNPGDSRFGGTRGNDTYDGGFGNDRIGGGRGDDSLFGNYGDDRIDGGDGNDRLDGGVGVDKVDGGAGNDHIDGGTGDDVLSGDAGDDALNGGVGNDKLDGGDGSDVVLGSFGDDWITGGKGDDQLQGDQGADTLDGGKGNDTIDGGGGNDSIIGGRGFDELIGGGGSDTFIFTKDTQQDTVLDFGAEDRLDFSEFQFATPEAALDAARQVGSDVVFTLRGDVVVTLADTDLNDLHANNLIVHYDLF